MLVFGLSVLVGSGQLSQTLYVCMCLSVCLFLCMYKPNTSFFVGVYIHTRVLYLGVKHSLHCLCGGVCFGVGCRRLFCILCSSSVREFWLHGYICIPWTFISCHMAESICKASLYQDLIWVLTFTCNKFAEMYGAPVPTSRCCSDTRLSSHRFAALQFT